MIWRLRLDVAWLQDGWRRLRRACGQAARSWRRDLPDEAWKPTGIRQVYSGYDQTKAEAAARRSPLRQALKRELAGDDAPINGEPTDQASARNRITLVHERRR
jgi:hypothetical protein